MTISARQKTNPRTTGASVEHILDQLVHPLYERQNLATLWHNGNKAVRRYDGTAKFVHGRPDYDGVCGALGGRAICFDAKHCASDTYRHAKAQLHQLPDILKAWEFGAIAGILVVNWKKEAAWWLWPRPEWGNAEFEPTKLERYSAPNAINACVPTHYAFPGEFIPDWLSLFYREEEH